MPQIAPYSEGRSAQYVSRTISAGGSEQISGQGDVFYFIECYSTNVGASTAALVWVKVDQGPEQQFSVGTGQRVPAQSQFLNITVRNDTGNDIYIKLFVGYGDYIDNRLNVVYNRPLQIQPTVTAQTTLKQSSIVSIPSSSFVEFDGSVSGTELYRKDIYISNLDPSTNIRVTNGDTSGNVGGITVFKNSSIVLETSAVVRIYNDTGAPISVTILESFYLNQ